MPSQADNHVVAAAFAHERDAAYAVRLISSFAGDVRFTLRRVLGERGDVEMVVLEATLACQDMVARVGTVMQGTHGVLVPPEVIKPASRRSVAS